MGTLWGGATKVVPRSRVSCSENTQFYEGIKPSYSNTAPPRIQLTLDANGTGANSSEWATRHGSLRLKAMQSLWSFSSQRPFRCGSTCPMRLYTGKHRVGTFHAGMELCLELNKRQTRTFGILSETLTRCKVLIFLRRAPTIRKVSLISRYPKQKPRPSRYQLAAHKRCGVIFIKVRAS